MARLWLCVGDRLKRRGIMKLSHVIAPALAALLATACAANSEQSATDRAARAETDRDRARDDARKAQMNTERARADAQDAARAQYEADQKARFAAQAAAQTERDAQAERGAGIAEPQPVGVRVAPHVWSPGVAFAVGSPDLTGDDKARLGEIADSLRAHPSHRVVVEGYSDNVDADGQLSHRRADCVSHYLEKKGISSDRITTRVTSRNAARYADDANHHGLSRGVEIYIN
jgi:outer membrane protein OmpA-like peptidoglycan-associated protein